MRFIALALIMTVASIGCGFSFSKGPALPSGPKLRDELWSPLPGGVSLWEQQPAELPLYVYSDPSVEKRVRMAIAEWNRLLGAEVLVYGTLDRFDIAIVDGTIVPDPWRNPNLNGITKLVPIEGGRYPILPVVILYTTKNQTLMHELGHALGLEHDPEEPYSVMFPYSSGRMLPYVEQIDLVVLRWVFDI